jgi:serine/threonine-protein kinase
LEPPDPVWDGSVDALVERLQAAIDERYTIERELGRGGMATVYLARDIKHDRPVAIKVLQQDLAMMLGPERFRREIQLVTHLSHPHILPIYDSGEVGGSLHYVMPFVAGESLRARLDRERLLPVDEAIDITCQIAAALDYAHRQGIVHRDIKPENILLEDGQAVVADFGIAHAMSAAGEEKLTQTGLSLGTPMYMSPEQATGERSIDGRSDVYSLACVCYEMLVGQPPFVGPNAQAIIARHTLEHVPSLTIVRNTIPPHVEAAVLRALEKVPVDRFQTAGAFADALRNPDAATGRTRWTGANARAARPRTRRGIRAAVALVAVVAALALGVAGWERWHRGPAPGLDAGPDPRRLAVLFFRDESSDRSLGYLADGLTDALITRLKTVPELDVLSANASALYRHTDVPRDSIARALQAGTLVDGSVERHGSRLSVSVRLADASGTDFRRATFDAPAGNVLTIPDTLAVSVARFLRQRLGEEIRLREERLGTRSPDAWADVQRAQHAMRDADSLGTRADSLGATRAFARADSLLAQAAARDPRWVTPVVLRGTIDYKRSRLTDDRMVIANEIQAGLGYAERALALDPRSPDALELRGTLHYWRHLNGLATNPAEDARLVASAQRDLEAVVRVAPSRASAWSVLAHLYFNKPDPVDGLLASRKAYEEDAYLSAAPDILWRLYGGSFDLEKFADAASYCREGHTRFPSNPRFVLCQLYLLAAGAQPADVAHAWRLVDTLGQLTPKNEWEFQRRQAQMLVAGALVHAREPDSARRVLVRARGDPTVDPGRELLGDEAWVRTMLGDRDEAITLLKQYLVANPEHRAGMARNQNWWWRSLRDDPRYQQLVGTAE